MFYFILKVNTYSHRGWVIKSGTLIDRVNQYLILRCKDGDIYAIPSNESFEEELEAIRVMEMYTEEEAREHA